MPSDDDLAKIIYRAWRGSSDADADVDWDVYHDLAAQYWETARAVRAALLPDVAPLAPGETVTIPDRWWLPTDTVYAGLTLNESACYPDLSVIADDGEVGVRVRLDAAGVRALQTACDRFLAAQEDDDGGE